MPLIGDGIGYIDIVVARHHKDPGTTLFHFMESGNQPEMTLPFSMMGEITRDKQQVRSLVQ